MVIIDGMNGVDACYHFAGIASVSPKGLTLRQLFAMATGRISQTRQEMFEQSILIWGMDGIDAERYLLFGELEQTGKGGPPKLSPELDRKVAEAAEEMRRQNPKLPKVSYG